MDGTKKKQTTIVVEDAGALQKKMLEKQFSDIFNRAAEQWRISSQNLVSTHP